LVELVKFLEIIKKKNILIRINEGLPNFRPWNRSIVSLFLDFMPTLMQMTNEWRTIHFLNHSNYLFVELISIVNLLQKIEFYGVLLAV
jgi:hypothetical protein